MSKLALFRTKSFQLLFILALVVGAGLVFAIDSDNDGMSDLYENFFQLNPTNSTDAVENYDSDLLNNLQESIINTDPAVPDIDADGFPDHADSNALSRAVIWWGVPAYTDGNAYTYTGPDWWLGAGRDGGTWNDDGGWQLDTNTQGMLYIDIDRSMVTNNLMLNLLHVNAVDSVVYLALANANEGRVALDLFGDLTSNNSEQVLSRYILPLASYPTASRIIIDATAATEPYTVWATTLYVDMDADGLDADQEAQFGTLDSNLDCDTDNLTDYVEAMVEGTDPLNPDTDHDGFTDGLELNELGTSPLIPMGQEGGIAGILQVERWNAIEGYSMADLKAAGRFGGAPNAISLVTSAEYAPPGLEAGENYGIRMRGTITAPVEGTYSFQLTGDCQAEVWLADTPSPYGRRKLLYLGHWTNFRDLADPVVPSATVDLAAGQTCYVEILLKEDIYFEHVTLWWTRPGETEPAVIGSRYLHSYVQPADDADMDGLPDAFDPNALDGTGGGYKDTDGDGFSDHEEINFMGTSPIISMWQDGVAGVLQVERWNAIEGYTTADLKTNERFGGANDSASLVTSAEYAPDGFDAGDNYGIRMRGTITAPAGGAYTFKLTGDCDAEVWMSDTESPFGRKLILGLASWTGFQELEHPLVPSATVELAANQSYYVEVLLKEDMYLEHVSLWWTLPGEIEPEVIGSQYLHSYVQPADDQDADGLPDALETAGGLDPQDGTGGGYKDTDGDGFTDHDEINFMGSSPIISLWQDGVPGVLQVERWNDIKGFTTGDLKSDVRFGTVPEASSLVTSAEYAPEGLDAGENYGIRMRGTITAPTDGTYTFKLTGDCAAEVWLSDTESPYGRKLLLDLTGWTDFRNLSDGDVPVATVALTANQAYYVEILLKEDRFFEHVSLWWTLPSEIEPEVIGSQYLYSYIQPEGDRDADGLPDAWELACGLDPQDGTGGGYKDTDGDTYSDFVEFVSGLDPQVADADADGLSDGDEVFITQTDPDSADTDDDGIRDLRTVLSIPGADFVDYYDSHISATWSIDGTDAVVIKPHALPWVAYSLTITNAGMYRIAVDATYLLDYEVRLVVEIDGIQIDELWKNHSPDLPAYTFFTPWLSEGEHTLKLSVRSYFEEATPFHIHSIELGEIDGCDADGNGMQDWMQAILLQGLDTDKDGITDADELQYGTSPTDADSDGDGLNDGDELAVGTDPLDADSDDDGVVDGVEVNESLTNPLVAEFDGTITVVETVSGAATNAVVGAWEVQGSELLSKGARGSVEYVMNFPTNDLLRLNISAVHSWSKNSCSPVIPKDTSAFLVYVDEVYVGKFPFISADGVYVDVNAFLPVMPTGEHTVKLFWENVSSRLAVKVQSLELQSLGGADNNGNGTKDWVEASIAAMAGFDGMSESIVSPACIEGNARYVPFMQIQGLQDAGDTNVSPTSSRPCQSAGSLWYANLPLEDGGTITETTASFQSGALEVPINVKWVPYNLLDHNGATIQIRKGDSMRLTCVDPSRARPNLETARGGQFTLNVSGTQYSSRNTRPQVVAFDQAGTYTVNGTYRKGNSSISASINVQVIDGSFPEGNPACLVGRTRQWSFEGSMPTNIVLETDESVESALLGSVLITNNNSRLTVSLKANDTNGDHIMLARLYPDGPILDSARLDTFWVQNATDGFFWTVERFEDSELWEVNSVVKNLPDTVDLQIKVKVGGVTLDDYTLERWLTNADYDETGEYNFRLYHPNDEQASVCHTFKVYQDGQLIGEAYGAGQNDIEEE